MSSGRIVEIGGERRTVVGVLAEGFHFPSPREEAWTPYVMPLGRGDRRRAGDGSGRAIPAERAATEVHAILQRTCTVPRVPAPERGTETDRHRGDTPEIRTFG